MLKTSNPNISIITNFGCRAGCWYCIWKGHKLEFVQQPTDWQKLYNFLKASQNKGKVSVSGGGDCLYHYDMHKKWWDTLFSICDELKLLVDIHTREKFYFEPFWDKVNRCVFSSDKLIQDKTYLLYLSDITKLRITHLVTADTTIETIKEYLDFQKEKNCQFTIKQLIGHSDNGMYDIIRKEFPEIYNLDAGDYNIYYMPDNTITDSFL